VLAYYVRYLIWTLGLVALGGVIVLLVWIDATGDEEDAGETYQPVLTEHLASRLAFTSLLSSGQAVIACGIESSVLPDDAEIVYMSNKTWVVTLGNCAFVIGDATGEVTTTREHAPLIRP
jgi:hypothetical protein